MFMLQPKRRPNIKSGSVMPGRIFDFGLRRIKISPSNSDVVTLRVISFTDVFVSVRLPEPFDEKSEFRSHHVRGDNGQSADGVPVVRRSQSDR